MLKKGVRGGEDAAPPPRPLSRGWETAVSEGHEGKTAGRKKEKHREKPKRTLCCAVRESLAFRHGLRDIERCYFSLQEKSCF